MAPHICRFGNGANGGQAAAPSRRRSRVTDAEQRCLAVFEIHVVVEHLQGDKEPMPSGEARSGLLPQLAQQITGGAEGKGNQIQGEQCIGQSPFTVAEVVFHMAIVVFQHVERLVFDLPAASAPGGECFDIVAADVQRGDERVAAGDFPIFCRTISIDSQLTCSACSSSRSGMPRLQR